MLWKIDLFCLFCVSTSGPFSAPGNRKDLVSISMFSVWSLSLCDFRWCLQSFVFILKEVLQNLQWNFFALMCFNLMWWSSLMSDVNRLSHSLHCCQINSFTVVSRPSRFFSLSSWFSKEFAVVVLSTMSRTVNFQFIGRLASDKEFHVFCSFYTQNSRQEPLRTG